MCRARQRVIAMGESQSGGRLNDYVNTVHPQVADVFDGYSEQTSIAKLNHRQVVTFGIERAKGASEVTVYDAAIKEMKKIEADSQGAYRLTPADTVVACSTPEVSEAIWGALVSGTRSKVFCRPRRVQASPPMAMNIASPTRL